MTEDEKKSPPGGWSEGHSETDVTTESDVDTRPPRRYKVLLHNDDYTTMEFVVMILTEVFHHSEEEATRIMLSVHYKDVGVAGVYTYEVAETKVRQVSRLARANEFPLKCSMEPE